MLVLAQLQVVLACVGIASALSANGLPTRGVTPHAAFPLAPKVFIIDLVRSSQQTNKTKLTEYSSHRKATSSLVPMS